MDLAKLLDKPSFQGTTRAVKRERSFELSLPVLVTGTGASGSEFQERTELYSISSQEASFWLNSGITIGSRINLSLKIPKTLILENQLRLIISGIVVYAKSDRNSKKKQLISIRLDKSYKILPSNKNLI
ncbi:MAG: hypothetical protein JSV96_11680 [Candidatus Aminicenantes bacterium]|nr:MAG: hypothetical protein JSV96_11680 [Candidatus Aminicenantes bacterium]